MMLQELATNAVKYGALSNADGAVNIRWMVDWSADVPALRFSWQETGGPSVSTPVNRGFGTRLIERSLAHDLDGNVFIAFEPAGVLCRIDAPLR
jgi:two-component sensor histidine kinase